MSTIIKKRIFDPLKIKIIFDKFTNKSYCLQDYLVEADFFSLTLLLISNFGHHQSDGYLCIQLYEMGTIFLRRKHYN